MSAIAEKRMTEAEFLALPDDGVRRWLVDGEVWEFGGGAKEGGMTVRNRDHGRVVARLGQILGAWLDGQPAPRGEVAGGEVGFRLPGDPVTVVGLDVAYADADLARRRPDDTTLYDGAPVLAVEVLSPSDTQEGIRDRVKLLLDGGVKVVWLADPDDQTIRVRRKGAPTEFFNAQQEITAEPELPGFRAAVSSLFSW